MPNGSDSPARDLVAALDRALGLEEEQRKHSKEAVEQAHATAAKLQELLWAKTAGEDVRMMREELFGEKMEPYNERVRADVQARVEETRRHLETAREEAASLLPAEER